MKTLLTTLMIALTASFVLACGSTPEPEEMSNAEANERKVSLRERKKNFADNTERATAPKE